MARGWLRYFVARRAKEIHQDSQDPLRLAAADRRRFELRDRLHRRISCPAGCGSGTVR
jgi:hypothetical protein